MHVPLRKQRRVYTPPGWTWRASTQSEHTSSDSTQRNFTHALARHARQVVSSTALPYQFSLDVFTSPVLHRQRILNVFTCPPASSGYS